MTETVIIRVEDSELWELEEVFYYRFKCFCKPHGSLPSGSLVLVGSMSHLAKNGLNFYTPILVETMTRMAGKVGPGVNVIPFVPVPIGGIGSETLARDMMDLELDRVHWCWAGHWSARHQGRLLEGGLCQWGGGGGGGLKKKK